MKKQLLLVLVAALSVLVLSSWSKADRKAYMDVPYYAGKGESTIKGGDFIWKIDGLNYWTMDDMIVSEVLAGNVPNTLRKFRKVTYKTGVDKSCEILSKPHKVEMWVLPDYISVGTDKDFVRMPMSTIAAQKIADALGCSLPTTYLVDRISEAAEGRIEIFPFYPVGERNMRAFCFLDSNNAINALMRAKGYSFGQFVSGMKKDLVLTCELERHPEYRDNIAIYGWHHPDGHPQQPLFLRHANFYSDYSHGARMIWRTIRIDGKEYDIRKVMEDPAMYRLVSDEAYPLKEATFANQKRKDYSVYTKKK